MAIKAGDVVMDFLADLSNLDEGFDKAKEKGEKWQDEVKGLNEKQADAYSKMWAEPAKAAEDAGKKVVDVASTAAAAAAQSSSTIAATVEGAVSSGGALAGGLEIAGLALEGVAVAATVAGGAIVAAFGGIIVAAFIEKIMDGAKALHDWYEGVNSIELAWQKYDTTVLSSSMKIQSEINAQTQKIIAMTDGPVAALDFALKHLETTAFQTFETISKEVDIALKAMNQSYSMLGLTSVFRDSEKDLGNFRDKLIDVMTTAQRQAPAADTTAAYRAGLALVIDKEKELTGTINQRTAASGLDSSAAVDGLHAERKAINDVYFDLKKGMELDQERAKALEKAKGEAKTKEAEAAAKAHAATLIANAKSVEQAELAAIQIVQAEQQKLFAEGKLDAAQWAVAQIKATNDSRAAHEKYLDAVAAAYKKTGQSAKALEAEQAAGTAKINDYAKAVSETAKATDGLRKEELTFGKLAADAWKETTKEINNAAYAKELLAKSNALPQWIKDSVALTNALKQIGIAGLAPLRQNLANVEKAEKLLNDAGVKDGRVWLQVQAAKLKAIIAIDQATGKSARSEIKALQDVEKELKRYGVEADHTRKDLHDMMEVMKSDAASFAQSIGDAFAAALTGQQTIGQAMIQASAKMVGQLASQWAEYWAGMAIADIFWHPAKAAAEFAASIALYTLAGVMGSVGGGGGSSSTGSTASSSGGGTSTPNAATQPAQNPVVVQNTARLATGGLVTRETQIVAGDGMSGGNAAEAILPLTNPNAMRAIAGAIAAQMGGMGGDHYHIKGDLVDHAQLSRKLSRQVKRGKARLTSANSLRVTRRS